MQLLRAPLAAGLALVGALAHAPRAQDAAHPEEPPLLEATAETPSPGHGGTAYVVLTNRTDERDPFHEAAAALAAWRKGHLVVDFDPRAPERVAPRLRELGARWVALVLAPEDIDTNTQRRFLMAAARLDDDLFVDVAFGYVTGTPATPPLALVERAKRLERDGIARRWVSASVASQIRSTVYQGAGDPTAARAGFDGRKIYWGAREADPDVLAFVDEKLPGIEPGGVVTFSGCGDPEGIWLFSDERNREREKHWAFDAEKVGSDPDGEMPRIGADRLSRAHLDGAVVWSGVCHTASLARVFVGGDIVSTFGTTKGHTEYRIPQGRSLAAAFLDAGAAALIAPVGPNHGYRNLVEAQEALERRLPLGDALRSTYGDVAMSQRRAPVLGLHLPDALRPDRGIGAIMGGGGANRVLYGDPALSPFRDVEVEPAVALRRRSLPDGGFAIEATVAAKDWWSWDMFAGDDNRARIRAVVDLEERDPRALRVAAEARGPEGKPIAAGRLDAAVEWIDGKRRLHLQIAAPRGSGLGEPGSSAVFRVSP